MKIPYSPALAISWLVQIPVKTDFLIRMGSISGYVIRISLSWASSDLNLIFTMPFPEVWVICESRNSERIQEEHMVYLGTLVHPRVAEIHHFEVVPKVPDTKRTVAENLRLDISDVPSWIDALQMYILHRIYVPSKRYRRVRRRQWALSTYLFQVIEKRQNHLYGQGWYRPRNRHNTPPN